jgi:hypothetical protein
MFSTESLRVMQGDSGASWNRGLADPDIAPSHLAQRARGELGWYQPFP